LEIIIVGQPYDRASKISEAESIEPTFVDTDRFSPGGTGMSRVLVIDVNDNLRDIVSQILEEFRVDVQGKRVLVKPNLVAALPPGCCTSPEVVEAVVFNLLEQGAEVMVGDGSSEIIKNSANTARIAGILDACHGCFSKIGAELSEVPANSAHTDTFLIPRAILECDYLINVPKFKSHNVMTLTGAIKNVLGYICRCPGKMSGFNVQRFCQ